MKTPLYLTFGRIILAPFFFIIYTYYKALGITTVGLPYVLILLLCISELSDFLDGFIARKYNLVTTLGKILDPMADSLVRLTILISFTKGIVQIPLFLVFIFMYRDFMISTLRTVCALKGITLSARYSGKIKSVILAIVVFIIIILMIPYSLGVITKMELQRISIIFLSLTAIYTIYSGIEYIYANRDCIKESLK